LPLPTGQNIGYVIGNEEIDGFFGQADGKPDGKPSIDAALQRLLNDALRNKHRLDRSVHSLLVIDPASSRLSYPLKKGDVITHIGAYAIDNDGMVRVQDNLRLAFPNTVNKATRGDCVPVTLLRQGKRQTHDVPVVRSHHSLMPWLDGKYPSYFVYGPLVFSPASLSLRRVLDGDALE
jgi:hypothetical protein